MKLKRRPDDFRVEELTDFAPSEGRFALYRLEKRGIGTIEAMQAVTRRWGIDRRRLSYGGLKDRHAATTQFVTVEEGPRRLLEQTGFRMEYLGQAPRPFTAKDITGNRFEIVLRDLTREALERAERAFDEAGRHGVPNYFDDQRFGSVGVSGDFVARPWCLGDWDKALWLAIAEANEHDRPEDRREKELLRSKWGRWPELKEALGKGNRRSLVTYLCDHPQNLRGAFERTNADLRSLWLAAFQSHVWNRILSEVVRERCGHPVKIGLKTTEALFWRELEDPSLRSIELPLPGWKAEIQAELRPVYERITRESGVELTAMKIRHPKGNFFSKGSRPASLDVRNPWREAGDDELYAKRRKLTLRFDLSRGQYATMVVKRLTTAAR